MKPSLSGEAVRSEPGSRKYDRITDHIITWSLILLGIPFLAALGLVLLLL